MNAEVPRRCRNRGFKVIMNDFMMRVAFMVDDNEIVKYETYHDTSSQA